MAGNSIPKTLPELAKAYVDPNLRYSVYTNQQNEVNLRIFRPENDKTRTDRSSISVEHFKRSLGLKNGVISGKNDSYASTGRAVWSDSATLDKGASISVPVKELGQEWYLFRGAENEALKEAAKKVTE